MLAKDQFTFGNAVAATGFPADHPRERGKPQRDSRPLTRAASFSFAECAPSSRAATFAALPAIKARNAGFSNGSLRAPILFLVRMMQPWPLTRLAQHAAIDCIDCIRPIANKLALRTKEREPIPLTRNHSSWPRRLTTDSDQLCLQSLVSGRHQFRPTVRNGADLCRMVQN